jgi:hypothetical protein
MEIKWKGPADAVRPPPAPPLERGIHSIAFKDWKLQQRRSPYRRPVDPRLYFYYRTSPFAPETSDQTYASRSRSYGGLLDIDRPPNHSRGDAGLSTYELQVRVKAITSAGDPSCYSNYFVREFQRVIALVSSVSL